MREEDPERAKVGGRGILEEYGSPPPWGQEKDWERIRVS